MIETELIVRCKPARDLGNGTISARTYPLTIFPAPEFGRVRLAGVSIVPDRGICEVWAGDPGAARRTAIGDGATAIPAAEASHFRPLYLTLVNLNPFADVEVAVKLVAWKWGRDWGDIGPGRATFAGAEPMGTDGSAETALTLADVDSSTVVLAHGGGWTAHLTTDGPLAERNIRELTGQTRVLSPTGTGTLPTSETGSMTLIIKQNGVTYEANAESLNLLSAMFALTTAAQQVNITGFSAGAIAAAALAVGAVEESKIAAGAVTESKLGDGAVTSAKLADSITVNTLAALVNVAAALIESTGDINGASVLNLGTSGSLSGSIRLLEQSGPTTTRVETGTGDPEGVVTADPGSLYCRPGGGADHTLYVKEANFDNTGWRRVPTLAP